MLFERSRIAELLAPLAARHNLYVGTMSWKYPGWCGTLYDEDRYLWGRHFSKARFKRDCLEEYAEVFKSVCVDATYYRMPRDEFLEDIASRVPDDFKFSFKVPDDVTIKKFPDIEAFGKRAGQENPYFLGHGIFNFGFLRHLEKIQPKVGMLIFEFSHFHVDDFVHGREFVSLLDEFFDKAPKGWQYAVEVRNKNLLHPDYFQMLARHGVAHIYNQWTRMPPVTEQLDLYPPSQNPFIAARYLLTPERSLDWAEREFSPYNQLKEIDPSARESIAILLDHIVSRPSPDRESDPDTLKLPSFEASSKKDAPQPSNPIPSYLYVGNQLEGNALHTIADALENSVVPTLNS